MIYDLIAPMYDKINSEIDYSSWADFIEKIIEREYGKRPQLVLDLGCGTGSMTLELASRGYDMTGIDLSLEMLDIARERASENNYDILWLCQDLREFELYGTVEVALSCLDTVNHISRKTDLSRFFALVHNYLDPDGLFIFDVNGKRKFETVYADRSYVMEEDGDVCIWQNDYDVEKELCNFYITLFRENSDGTFDRFDDIQRERMYTINTLRKMLTKAGFYDIKFFSDFLFSDATDDSERIYVIAKCKK